MKSPICEQLGNKELSVKLQFPTDATRSSGVGFALGAFHHLFLCFHEWNNSDIEMRCWVSVRLSATGRAGHIGRSVWGYDEYDSFG